MRQPPDATLAAVFYELGISAYYRGEAEVAQKFVAVACADPGAPAIWHRNNAEILDRCGLSGAAEAAARRAVRRDPDYAEAWDTLGTILFQRGSLEESRTCYETAVQIDANFVQAFNNLAVALNRMGQVESAEACYREALSLAPDSTEILLNFATLLAQLGRHREGLKIVGEVLDRNPNLMRARSLLRGFRTILKSCKRRSKRI